MDSKTFHGQVFDDATKTKLELYRIYLNEWLPVFLNGVNASYIKNINIVDFFCGPGMDSDGVAGSPLIALNAVSDALEKNRDRLSPYVRVNLYFNDIDQSVISKLKDVLLEQKYDDNRISMFCSSKPFHECYNSFASLKDGILRQDCSANFLFIDQFGVKEVSQEIFHDMQQISRTDFMFFIAASIVNRMHNQPSIKDKIPVLTEKETQRINAKNVVRILADAYKRWKIGGKDFYLGQFALRKPKSPNVNGLIFGSSNILGLDKFLQAAWKVEPVFGEANYSVDDSDLRPEAPFLFDELNVPTRTKQFNKNLEDAICTKQIKTNHEIYYFSLQQGFLPKHAREVVKELQKRKVLLNSKISISNDCLKSCPIELEIRGEV
ncbi:MAG: three-Cys-motif partner protein TcmP [Kiritimatiellae bacterium]|nr:three-Cys-motif partner protein TcmP [Kiritimatiellia bacterium]